MIWGLKGGFDWILFISSIKINIADYQYQNKETENGSQSTNEEKRDILEKNS